MDVSKKIINEITPNPLIDLNIAAPPDTDDKMDGEIVNDIDFTITDSQLVEGNDTNVNRDTAPFVDFTVTNSHIVDSDDEIETINVTMDDNIIIPNANVIGRDTDPLQRKKILTTHLTQAVQAAKKITKKYQPKWIGKKLARISTDDCLKQQNKKGTKWLKDQGFLDDNVSVKKADVGETIDLRNTSGATIVAKNIVKKYRNLARKKPYSKRPARIFTEDNNDVEDIIDLGEIATLKPSKNAQIAGKKISEKYKEIHNRKNAKKAKVDDIDFTITDSRVVDGDIGFAITDLQVIDDDIDFNVVDSRAVDDESDIDFAVTDSHVNDSDIDFNITDSKVITNQNAKAAAKTISQKYKNIWQKKACKLLKLAALKDKNNKDPAFKKSTIMAPELVKNIKG